MKKEDKKKVFTSINMGIFYGYCFVSAGYTTDQVLAYLKGNKNTKDWAEAFEVIKPSIEKNDSHCQVDTVTVTEEGKQTKYYFLYMKQPFGFTDHEMCELAHECLHLCQTVLPDYLDRDKEMECEAYLHTHLMSQCLKVFRS
jgi:hypothetical protein